MQLFIIRRKKNFSCWTLNHMHHRTLFFRSNCVWIFMRTTLINTDANVFHFQSHWIWFECIPEKRLFKSAIVQKWLSFVGLRAREITMRQKKKQRISKCIVLKDYARFKHERMCWWFFFIFWLLLLLLFFSVMFIVYFRMQALGMLCVALRVCVELCWQMFRLLKLMVCSLKVLFLIDPFSLVLKTSCLK